MIEKTHRLKKNFQFSYIYKRGKAKHAKDIVVVFAKCKRQPFKVGFSVGKNVGKSVVRSLVKRRMSECFNALKDKVPTNYNYVFVAKPSSNEITFLQMKNQFELLLEKICAEN